MTEDQTAIEIISIFKEQFNRFNQDDNPDNGDKAFEAILALLVKDRSKANYFVLLECLSAFLDAGFIFEARRLGELIETRAGPVQVEEMSVMYIYSYLSNRLGDDEMAIRHCDLHDIWMGSAFGGPIWLENYLLLLVCRLNSCLKLGRREAVCLLEELSYYKLPHGEIKWLTSKLPADRLWQVSEAHTKRLYEKLGFQP